MSRPNVMKNYNTSRDVRNANIRSSVNETPRPGYEELESNLYTMRKEFAENALHNKQHISKNLTGLAPVNFNRKQKAPTPFISSQLKAHESDKKAGLGKQPRWNFETKQMEWVDSLVKREDKDVVDALLGYSVSEQTYIPQRLILDEIRPIAGDKLFALAFAEACLAVTKNIDIEVKITTSAGPVGIHYLVMLTVVYDLILACQGQVSIFGSVTPYYNFLRSFLTPRVIGNYSYSWSGIPDIAAELAAGVPFTLPTGNGLVSLAWPINTVNGFGQTNLANVEPVLQVEDLLEFGVPATEQIWHKILQQHEGNYKMVTPFLHTRAAKSAAAFAIGIPDNILTYGGYLNFMSEVPVYAYDFFISALQLVEATHPSMAQVKGKYVYNTYAGMAGYNWRLWNQDLSKRIFNPKPRQVPLATYFLQVATMILQADILEGNLPTKGNVTQPTDSVFTRINAGDFIFAITAFILKRYAMSNFIMLGTDAVNTTATILGIGTQFIIDYGAVINGLFPMCVTEGLASLTLKAIKTGNGMGNNGEFDLLIPHIVMTGGKLNADPVNNSNAMDPLSLINLWGLMYPDATVVSYNWANFNPFQTLDITAPSIAFLYGDAIANSMVAFNEFIDSLQGNFDIGLTLANVHEEDYTLADYTYFCDPLPQANGWDRIVDVKVKSLGSCIPIDPNKVADQMTRILPVVWGSDFSTYINQTGETISLQLDMNYGAQIVVNAAQFVHKVAGRGAETAIMDFAITARGQGGGVMDWIKRTGSKAVSALSMVLGGIMDKKFPGSGSIVNGIGDVVTNMLGSPPETPFERKLVGSGHLNPYAKVYRPVTDVVPQVSTIQHITRKQRYY